jgi:hypothetical protein
MIAGSRGTLRPLLFSQIRGRFPSASKSPGHPAGALNIFDVTVPAATVLSFAPVPKIIAEVLDALGQSYVMCRIG